MSDEGDIYQPTVEFAMMDKSRSKRVGFIVDEGKESDGSAGETDLGMVSPVFNFADPDATVDVKVPSEKADYAIENDGEYDDDDEEEEEETDENNDDGDDEDDGDDNGDGYEQSGEHVKQVLYQKHKTTSGGFQNSARKHTIETKTTIEQRTVTVAVTESEERYTKYDETRNINEPSASSQKLGDESKTEVSSLDINLDKLKQSGKIKRVAVFDLQGQPLAYCNHTTISAEDGRTIALTLDSSYNGMTRLRIGKMNFTCFRKGQNSSLVGWSDSDFLYIFRGENLIVLVLSDPASPGSSIYEVSRFMERCSNDRTSSFVAGLSEKMSSG